MTALRLDEPLPGTASRLSYRSFPAYSRRWLVGRARVLGGVVLAIAGMFITGALVDPSSFTVDDIPYAVGSFVVAAMGMLFVGPLLAAWVRYANLPRALERVLVVLAIAVGVGVASALDAWASDAVQQARAMDSPDAGLADVIVGLLIYLVVGGGLALPGYFGEERRRTQQAQLDEVARLQRAKHDLDRHLGLLQAQIEPHFLFNTLASIRSLVTRRPEAAEATLDALVEYLRATIPRLRGVKIEHTVGEQLDVCHAYLEIMAARLGRLTFRVDPTPALRGHPFLPLVVLTLVENAVKHGIERKAGPGHIDVVARRDGSTLVVEVIDDGVGLAPGGGAGVGLRNLREQLRVAYGERARFELATHFPGGTRAAIVLDGALP